MVFGRDHRAGERTRTTVKKARREAARDNGLNLALISIPLVAVFVVLALVEWRLGGSPFLAGFLLGAGITSLVAGGFWVVDHVAGAHNAKFGTYGEEATADAFRSRAARRRGWRIVHNIPFDQRDVDHVAFGPFGVLAIETKWANRKWTVRDGGIDTGGRDPLDQAWQGARKIRCLLRSASVDTLVVPVVIQWGPGGLEDVDWSQRWFEGDVLVLRGRDRNEWIGLLDSFTADALDPAQVSKVRAALEGRVTEAARSGRDP